ncbi:hypothetical protein A2U01_0080531, partial [Trifolium medium]|nr:hypothetical protein [Trifolium medium]
MIGDCNISWVEEFYSNAWEYAVDDYTSTLRASAYTDEEYTEMLQTLALPGRDWR